MDGNGRWAQGRNRPRYEGHGQGAKTAETISQSCVDLGMQSLTLYSFSMENWKRPKAEVNALMHLYADYLVGIRPNLMRNNVKLLHLGRMEGLPESVINALLETMALTKANTGMVLALALNYSGRAEIVDATRAIAQACVEGRLRPEDIDETLRQQPSVHGRAARSRPADPHGQRASRQQLSPVADLLQRVLCDRHSLAGLQRRVAGPGDSGLCRQGPTVWRASIRACGSQEKNESEKVRR